MAEGDPYYGQGAEHYDRVNCEARDRLLLLIDTLATRHGVEPRLIVFSMGFALRSALELHDPKRTIGDEVLATLLEATP